jgi:hypothetical protein
MTVPPSSEASPAATAASLAAASQPAANAGREKWSGRLLWAAAAVLAVVVGKNALIAYGHYQQIHAVRCDEPVWRFATAFSGDVLDHTFHVTNVGHRPVQIKKLLVGCGCTTITADLEGREMGPRESFDVPVTLRLSGTDRGDIQKGLVVVFAGEPERKLTLKLAGAVEPRGSWSPKTVLFDPVSTSIARSQAVTVTRHPQAPPTVLTHVNASPFLHAEFAPNPSDPSGRTWTVTVSTRPPLPPGRQQGSILIETSDAMPLAATIPVIFIAADENKEKPVVQTP